MKRLAVIPARGGSKRIPDKNIRNFCGRPMLAHILSAANASGLFTTIHVSTDSQRIRDVAGKIGSPPDFLRPDELARDDTPIMPVLRYVLEEYANRGLHFDEVWLLMACAPLIEASDLISASTFSQKVGSEHPLVAVSEYPVPIEWAFKRSQMVYLRLFKQACLRFTSVI